MICQLDLMALVSLIHPPLKCFRAWDFCLLHLVAPGTWGMDPEPVNCLRCSKLYDLTWLTTIGNREKTAVRKGR